MKYQFEDFQEGEAWLVFRLDTHVKHQSVDIYMIMDLPNGIILAHAPVVDEILGANQAEALLQDGQGRKGARPKRLILVKGDPAEEVIHTASTRAGIRFESLPASYVEDILVPVKESFGQQFFSLSSVADAGLREDADEYDRASVRQMIPDSYDPCPCASGKKFKFCCKPIFGEIIEAMMAAEEGQLAKALECIARAKAVAGETAEVLCREAIVYSYFDPSKSYKVLKRCLKVAPNHPRANYIRGLTLKNRGDYHAAIECYERAIANYPKTDRYHLNEAYNNLGTALYEAGEFAGAKAAWEQALVLLPSDKTVINNLVEFIYGNPDLSATLREVSPFVRKFIER